MNKINSTGHDKVSKKKVVSEEPVTKLVNEKLQYLHNALHARL